MTDLKRTSNIGVQIEYVPADKVRTSNIGIMAEYIPAYKIRTSGIAIMIEYTGYTTNILGPRLQNN